MYNYLEVNKCKENTEAEALFSLSGTFCTGKKKDTVTLSDMFLHNSEHKHCSLF